MYTILEIFTFIRIVDYCMLTDVTVSQKEPLEPNSDNNAQNSCLDGIN